MFQPFTFYGQAAGVGTTIYTGFNIQTGSGEYYIATSSVATNLINGPRIQPLNEESDQSILLYRWTQATTNYSMIGSLQVDTAGGVTTAYPGQIVRAASARNQVTTTLTSASSYVAIYRDTNNDVTGHVCQYNTGTNQFTIQSALSPVFEGGANAYVCTDAVGISSNRFVATSIYSSTGGHFLTRVIDVTGKTTWSTVGSANQQGANCSNHQYNGKLTLTGSANDSGFLLGGVRGAGGTFGGRYIRYILLRGLTGTPVFGTFTTLYDRGSGAAVNGISAFKVNGTTSVMAWGEDASTGGADALIFSTLTTGATISMSGSVQTTAAIGTHANPLCVDVKELVTEGDFTYFVGTAGSIVLALCKIDISGGATDGDITIIDEKTKWEIGATTIEDAGFITPHSSSVDNTYGIFVINQNTGNMDYVTGSLTT